MRKQLSYYSKHLELSPLARCFVYYFKNIPNSEIKAQPLIKIISRLAYHLIKYRLEVMYVKNVSYEKYRKVFHFSSFFYKYSFVFHCGKTQKSSSIH